MPYGNDSLGFLSRNSSNNVGRRLGGLGGSGGLPGFDRGQAFGTNQYRNPFLNNFAQETYQTAISDLRNRREQNNLGQRQGELGLNTTRFQNQGLNLQNQSLADLNKFRGGLFDKIRGDNYSLTGGEIGTNASGAPSFADLFRSKLTADFLRSLVG